MSFMDEVLYCSQARRSLEARGGMVHRIWIHVPKRSVLFEISWKEFCFSSFCIMRFHEDTMRCKNSRHLLKNELVWKTIHSINLPWMNSLFWFWMFYTDLPKNVSWNRIHQIRSWYEVFIQQGSRGSIFCF